MTLSSLTLVSPELKGGTFRPIWLIPRCPGPIFLLLIVPRKEALNAKLRSGFKLLVGATSLGSGRGCLTGTLAQGCERPALSEVFGDRENSRQELHRPVRPYLPMRLLDKAYRGACRRPGYPFHPGPPQPSQQASMQDHPPKPACSGPFLTDPSTPQQVL